MEVLMAVTQTLPAPGGTFTTPDNDAIRFDVSSGTPGRIGIVLKTNPNVTWWKGVEIFGDTTWNRIGEVQTQDANHGPAVQNIDIRQFVPDRSRLEFWKAKAFGVHTDIVNYTFDPLKFDGKVMTFLWQSDSA
jgi:hypothetical protein